MLDAVVDVGVFRAVADERLAVVVQTDVLLELAVQAGEGVMEGLDVPGGDRRLVVDPLGNLAEDVVAGIMESIGNIDLNGVAAAVERQLNQSDRFADVKSTVQEGNPEIQILFDHERAARLGLGQTGYKLIRKAIHLIKPASEVYIMAKKE